MKANIEEKIKNKIILITGGTGSFGAIVVRELLTLGPKKIIIFSRDEKKQDDMRNIYNNSLLKFVIGDVRDKESVDKIVRGVDYIFHAAALKQVPVCEFFPMEAVKTNIFGMQNIINASLHHQVKRVTILSTDKAVYPINTMGMTKALMEKIMIAESKNYLAENGNMSTIFSGVRYGNVLYSRGSVLPYFISQIKQNRKLSVTHFGMTRFLLSLSDAVDLVFYALTRGENGHIYIRKSPACTIEVLAKAVCKIFKHKQGYEEVGVRAGEKMHETLVSREERFRAKDEGNYYNVPPESQGLDYNKYLLRGEKLNAETSEPYTSENTERLNVNQTIQLLLTLPEIQKELSK